MIVMCLDNKEPYVSQAKVALKSISYNSPNTSVVMYLVNFKENPFKNIHNLITVVNIKKNNVVKEFMTSFSTVAMYKTLLDYKQSIIWLDVDTIIRGDLTPIFEDVEPNTLKLIYRGECGKHTKFNTGVVVVGYSKNTIEMMKQCSEDAMKNQQWYADQLFLYKTYNKHKDTIKLIHMNWKWNDLGGREDSFSDTSIIWHCKAAHFDESPYKEAYAYYFGEINK